MDKIIQLALVEDHTLVRNGLRAMLGGYNNINVLFDVGNGRELLEQLVFLKPGIILLDIEMPLMSGLQTLLLVKKEYPAIKVAMLTSHFTEAFIAEYIQAGACAFIAKNCRTIELVETIGSIESQGYYYSAHVAAVLAQQQAPVVKKTALRLTVKINTREIQVLELLRQNKTNRQIADALCISPRTVEGNRQSLMQKTGAHNLAALLTYALANKLLAENPGPTL